MKEKVYNLIFACLLIILSMLFFPAGVLAEVIPSIKILFVIYFILYVAAGYVYFWINIIGARKYWVNALLITLLFIFISCFVQNIWFNIIESKITVIHSLINLAVSEGLATAGFFAAYLVLTIRCKIEKSYDGYYIIGRSTKVRVTKITTIIFWLMLPVFIFFAVFSCARPNDRYIPGTVLFSMFALMCILMLITQAIPNAKVKNSKIWLRKGFIFYEHDLSEYKSSYCSTSGYYILTFSDKEYKIPSECVNLGFLLKLLEQVHNPYNNEVNVEKLISYIKKETKKPAVNLIPDTESVFDIFISKIGGLPYWDFKKEYPVDEDGVKMQLLCQLNFSECKVKNTVLPKSGILQFFISEKDSLYGVNFEDQTVQKNWRVVYHARIDKKITADKIKKLNINEYVDENKTPILKHCALKFVSAESYMPSNNSEFEELLTKGVEKVSKTYFKGSVFDLLGPTNLNPYAEKFYRTFSCNENSMLSYPEFCQDDPRENLTAKEAKYFDTVLLQLVSSCGDRNIMSWGDGGIANFFINSKALKEKDFSKILYNWDCF